MNQYRDRAFVRGLVEQHSQQLRGVLAAGGNAYQCGLDQEDEIARLAEGLSSDDRDAFLRLYEQEALASAAATNDKAARLNAEAARLESEVVAKRIEASASSATTAGLLFVAALVALFFLLR